MSTCSNWMWVPSPTDTNGRSDSPRCRARGMSTTLMTRRSHHQSAGSKPEPDAARRDRGEHDRAVRLFPGQVRVQLPTLLPVCRTSSSSGPAPWGRRRRGGWRGVGARSCCSSSSSKVTSTGRATGAPGSSGSPTTTRRTCAWRRRRCRCGASSKPTPGRTLLDTTGAVDHGDPRLVDAVAAALQACGAAHEVIHAAEARERWPGMRFEGDVVFHPDGGRCRADDAVRALQDRAAALGADVRFGTGRAALRTTSRGVEVDVAGETISCARRGRDRGRVGARRGGRRRWRPT